MLQLSTRDHDQIDNRCECVCISCLLVESVTVGELSPSRLTPSSLGACPGTRGGHALGGDRRALLRCRSAQMYKYAILRGVVGGGPSS